MGDLFSNLCKGPVIVIDDEIDDQNSSIYKLVETIESKNLPVLKYSSPEKAKKELNGLVFSNFVIFDWLFKKTSADETLLGIGTGEAEKEIQVQENINFIKDFQKVCMAPIFIISNVSKDDIEHILEQKSVLKEENNFVFVQDKAALMTPGSLFQQIEEWIQQNPHVYLSKWWTNEWLTKNNSVFWNLYQSLPNWPSLIYKTLKKDGDEPILGLIEMLSQLIYSNMNSSSVDASYIESGGDHIEDINALKDLFKMLIYTTIDIEKNIRPGDVFKEGRNYYLNIRPECDTTKRKNLDEVELYLIKGKKCSSKVKNYYDEKYGILERNYQIILILLDGKDCVEFNKRELTIRPYEEMKDKKICRVVPPYITRIRQSFASFLGRFGTPAYPRELLNEIFNRNTSSSKNKKS